MTEELEAEAQDVPEVPVPHADAEVIAAVEALEAPLRETRPLAIGALLASTVLLRIGGYASGIVVPFRLIDLSNNPRGMAVLVGGIGATAAITEMVFAPFLARMADKIGRNRVLIGGPLIGLLAVMSAWASVKPEGFIFARALEGLGAAAFVPTALALIATATAHGKVVRAQASGAFEGATIAGIAGGFVVGPFAYMHFGRGAFFIIGSCYLLSALVTVLFVPNVPPLKVTPLRDVFRAAVGPGPIRSFLPAWVGTFSVLGALSANLPSLLRHSRFAVNTDQSLVHRFPPQGVGLILVSWLVLLLVGIALWTPWLPRLGAARTMRRVTPGALLLAASMILANHLPFNLALLAGPGVLIGIFWLAGFGPAAVAYLAECSDTFAADRSALMSFYTVTLAAGGALGAGLGGFAVGLDQADGLFILVFGLALFTFFMLGPVVAYERALLHETGEDKPEPDELHPI